MTFQQSPSTQQWPSPLLTEGFPTSLRGSPEAFEADRLLDEVREALDRDPISARRCVERLAQVLDATVAQRALVGARGGLSPWQLRRVREHVAANLSEPLPIAELARLVRLSTGHFGRAFRASVGDSPHAYILRQRIEEAKRLLLSTDEPICQIALSCGMSDQAHLSRMFKRYVGQSPAIWRRRRIDAPLLAA